VKGEMEICLRPDQYFNLELSLCCGQVFTWRKSNEWWYGVIGGEAVKVRQIGNLIEFEDTSSEIIRHYFGLNDNLKQILSEIAKDPYIESAVKALKGLRIIRQDPWECLASFICATYKSIPAIKSMLWKLSRKFGEAKEIDGYTLYTFPTVERISKANLKDLTDCGLGFRAKYLLETARTIASGEFDLERLKKESYEQGRRMLLTLPGVGLKVADCVLLFSFEKLEAFPVDVWIKRAMVTHYAEHFEKRLLDKVRLGKSLEKREYESISRFGREYFGRYAGYAQEYIYHYERMGLSY